MTEQEAIEQLERISKNLASIGEEKDYTSVAISALEKQIAKKPIRNDLCTCPNCGTHNEVIKKRRNTVNNDIVYCWHCGQAVEVNRLE